MDKPRIYVHVLYEFVYTALGPSQNVLFLTVSFVTHAYKMEPDDTIRPPNVVFNGSMARPNLLKIPNG